jgi:ADP-heptose:LPS heptosyltransferase
MHLGGCMELLISPYSQNLRNGNRNPKNYPYWPELIKLLEEAGHHIIQIGLFNEGALVKDFRQDLTFKEIEKLIKEVDMWISVDSFLPHLAHHVGKRGIVIWGKSDYKIFGYEENINIYKDRKYFRINQFDVWEKELYDANVFVEPKEIIDKFQLI